MGREVKRVSLDFDWPLRKIWIGYDLDNPCCKYFKEDCNKCKEFTKIAKVEDCPSNHEIEPPKGEAYQIWETVSEGSPITPPFKTPEELAKYCADNNVSSFGEMTEDYETWLNWITKSAWAPSCIMIGGVMKSGIKAFSDEEK